MDDKNNGYNPTAEQQQNMDNLSFDRKFRVNAVEVLVYNPLTKALDRMVQDSSKFATSDIDEGTVTYIGEMDADGEWKIEKVDSSVGVSVTYATILNNPTFINYTDAWTNRATLTYEIYSSAY